MSKHRVVTLFLFIGLIVTSPEVSICQIPDSNDLAEAERYDYQLGKAINCLNPDSSHYALLVRRLCGWGYIECGCNVVNSLDTLSLEPSEITKGIVDSVRTWIFEYGTGCKALCFWGDVCHLYNAQYTDSAFLSTAVSMYNRADESECENVANNYVMVLTYFADRLCSLTNIDSAFVLYYKGLSLAPGDRECLTGLATTADSISQIKAAISLTQNQVPITDSTSHRAFLKLLKKRIMHKETVEPSEVQKSLSKSLEALSTCKREGYLKQPEIERKVDSLYKQVKKKKGEDLRHSAVAFLDSALAKGLANPERYCDLADAFLELADDESDPDSSFTRWRSAKRACSECLSVDLDKGEKYSKKLMSSIVRILDRKPDLARRYCPLLRRYFEIVDVKYVDKKGRDRLLEHLKFACRIDTLRYVDKADKLWYVGDPAAEAGYKRALKWEESLSQSHYKLALIGFLDSLENRPFDGDSTKQHLKRAKKFEKNSKRNLLYEGLRRLVEHKYSGATYKLNNACQDLPNDPDVAYCLALAERLWADTLLKQDSVCEAAWHLELSKSAYASAVDLYGRQWPEITDSWVESESDSVGRHYTEIVKSCITCVENQMNAWVKDDENDKAIAKFSIMDSLYHDSLTSNIYLYLGDAYDGEEKYVEAEKAYVKALKLNPVNAWAQLGLGIVESEDASKTKQAISSLRLTILPPMVNHSDLFKNMGYYHLARALIRSGDTAKMKEGCDLLPNIRFKDEEKEEIKRVKELGEVCPKDSDR